MLSPSLLSLLLLPHRLHPRAELPSLPTALPPCSMCTTLGACIVFCASLAQPRFLAGSLAFAAGGML